jgi:hypothetical protein
MESSVKDHTDRSHQEITERAARVTAMLDRWEAEDVSGEPEWSVEELEPVTLRSGRTDRERRST